MVYLSLVVAVVLAIIDQFIKFIVINNLKPNGEFSILGGLVNFLYVENDGIAFGLMGNFRWIFMIVTVAVIIGIIVFMLVKKPKSKLFLSAATLIIGGGIGNLIDRVVLGYVIDYIQLSFFPPVCNFADYCVTIGTILLLIYLLFVSDYLKSDDKKLVKE